MKKLCFGLFSSLAALSLYADGQIKKDSHFSNLDELFEVQAIADASPVNDQSVANTQVARKQVGLNFYGDFLYWNVYPSNYTWEYQYNNIESTNSEREGTIGYQVVDFDWDVGFRIGMGYKTCYEGLELDLSWLRFHASTNLSAYSGITLTDENANAGLIPFMKNPYVELPGRIYSAASSIKFNLDQLDLVAKVPFKIIDRRFFVTPFGGARAVFFKSKMNSTFLTNTSNDAYSQAGPHDYFLQNQKDDFWALGLVAGLKGILTFNHGFSFFMNADAALVGGSDEYSTYEGLFNGVTGAIMDEVNGINQSSNKKFRPIVDLEAGLTWNRDFNDDSWGLGLKLAYEMHVYFDTPSFRYYYNAAPTVNTTYQGLTAGAQLRF